MKYKIPVVRTKLVKEYDMEWGDRKIFGIEGAEDIFFQLIGGATLERVAMICLDSNGRVINTAILNIGTLDKVDIVSSEIFRIALLSNAHSVIICHNHPSNDLEPSRYDIEMTKKIGYTASLLGIRLIDSLIVGNSRECYSIRKEINRMEKNDEV